MLVIYVYWEDKFQRLCQLHGRLARHPWIGGTASTPSETGSRETQPATECDTGMLVCDL